MLKNFKNQAANAMQNIDMQEVQETAMAFADNIKLLIKRLIKLAITAPFVCLIGITVISIAYSGFHWTKLAWILIACVVIRRCWKKARKTVKKNRRHAAMKAAILPVSNRKEG